MYEHDVLKQFTFTMNVKDRPVEICRFSLTADDKLHITTNDAMPMTEAASQFIAIVKDQLENINNLKIERLT